MNKPEKTEKKTEKKDVRPPAQSQIDQERGDWEGMGQSRYQPDEDASSTGTPTPGANSIANADEKRPNPAKR